MRKEYLHPRPDPLKRVRRKNGGLRLVLSGLPSSMLGQVFLLFYLLDNFIMPGAFLDYEK